MNVLVRLARLTFSLRDSCYMLRCLFASRGDDQFYVQHSVDLPPPAAAFLNLAQVRMSVAYWHGTGLEFPFYSDARVRRRSIRVGAMNPEEQTVTWLISLGVLSSPKKNIADPEDFLKTSLKDGVVLCKLTERLIPGFSPKVSCWLSQLRSTQNPNDRWLGWKQGRGLIQVDLDGNFSQDKSRPCGFYTVPSNET